MSCCACTLLHLRLLPAAARQVRLAFVRAVGSWLLHLRERRDHTPRLLPFLLGGLCDASPAVMAAAVALLDQLGAQYEAEHVAELADELRFPEEQQGGHEAWLQQALSRGLLAYGRDGGSASSSGAEAAGTAASEAAAPARAAAAFLLPGPFACRPRLGSRLLVRSGFGTALHALAAELGSWQAGLRGMAARLLCVNLLLVEQHAEHHLAVSWHTALHMHPHLACMQR